MVKSSNVVISLDRQFRKSTFVLQIYNGHYAGGKSCETSRENEIEMDPAFAAISRDNMLLAADQLSALSRGLRVTSHARSKLHLSDRTKEANKQINKDSRFTTKFRKIQNYNLHDEERQCLSNCWIEF